VLILKVLENMVHIGSSCLGGTKGVISADGPGVKENHNENPVCPGIHIDRNVELVEGKDVSAGNH